MAPLLVTVRSKNTETEYLTHLDPEMTVFLGCRP